MKRGYSQLNSSKEKTQENYSIMEKSELANELEYQEMLRTASQMQKSLDTLLKQCKQYSDQMPKPHYSFEEEVPENVADKCFQSCSSKPDAFISSESSYSKKQPSCSSSLPSKHSQLIVGNSPTMNCKNLENDPDAEHFGLQSRTSSETSHSTTSSCSSSLPFNHSRPKVGKKTPTELRHFHYQPKTITFKEFNDLLATRLSVETMQYELPRKFPFFYTFRNKYIIPLSEKFRGHRHIDLADLAETDEVFRNGFLDAYNGIFVEGCHIRREPRSSGKIAKKDTEERKMYIHLIVDLWTMLGFVFSN
jgi:hypothetical protein